MARALPITARLLPGVLLAFVGAAVPAASLGADAPAGSTTPAVLAPSKVVTITGHGYGHGHGMSQYGARGAAADGRSYRQILSFFYPRTTIRQASGRISVLITKDTTSNVVVQARRGLVAEVAGHGRTWHLSTLHPKASRWRIVPARGGRNELDYLSKGWHRQSVDKATLQFDGGGQPTRLYLPHGSAEYRGILRAATPKAGSSDRDTVNVVGLQDYVKGVVPTEMPSSWQQPAVRAQAVAARTYGVFERAANAHRYYQICDNSACQNYGGVSAEASGSNQAAAATSGQILTYGGKPAFAQFAASDGGWSRSGGEPYLVGKQDIFEKYADDPYRTWTTGVTIRQIEARWPSAGPIVSVSVTRDATKHWVAHVTIRGQKATYRPTGDEFREWAGLRSAYFGLKVG